MKDSDFIKLVGPINLLIGYAQTAENLTPETNLKRWGARLVQLANVAEKVWDEAIKTDSTVQEGNHE